MTTTPPNGSSVTKVTDEKLIPALRTQKNYRRWLFADTSALLSGGIYGFIFPLILLATTHSPVLV